MQIHKRIELFRKLLNLEDEQKKTRHLCAFFSYAQTACERWFGLPADGNVKCDIVTWHRTMFVPAEGLNHTHLILLALSPFEKPDCLNLGHEVYHCFTYNRRGVRELMPIDEMLATLCSLQLLKERGMEDYARMVEQRSLMRAKSLVDIPELLARKFTRRPDMFSNQAFVDAPIVDDLVCTGKALGSIVSWRAICQMIHSDTLGQWIVTLGDVGKEREISEVLCFPFEGEEAPMREDESLRKQQVKGFALALFWVGRRAQAITQLTTAIRRFGADPHMNQLLADFLFLNGQIAEGKAIYEFLIASDSTKAVFHTDFGMHLLMNGQNREAISYFQQLPLQDIGSHEVQYHLGLAYWLAKQYMRAEECWNRVHGTGNEFLVDGIRRCTESDTTPIFPFFSSL